MELNLTDELLNPETGRMDFFKIMTNAIFHEIEMNYKSDRNDLVNFLSEFCMSFVIPFSLDSSPSLISGKFASTVLLKTNENYEMFHYKRRKFVFLCYFCAF